MLDSYGEAVFGDEARKSIQLASEKTGAKMIHYHISPIALSENSTPGHEWLVEFETPPDDVPLFADIIDAHLQEVNRHYLIRRESEAFRTPRISIMSRGTFFEWLKQTKNRVSAQTKVPRMSEDRKIADALLKISGNNT